MFLIFHFIQINPAIKSACQVVPDLITKSKTQKGVTLVVGVG